MEIRNIAIIAHVDHGKTTLTDSLLEQTEMTNSGVSMDSNDLEKERGITIYSKNTSILYNGTKINILDTPGHADFGSEVERVLRSVDSVLLVVDAAEGPMPQTKFVLTKSLQLGLNPIVVLNKIDKPAADIEWAEEAIYELFLDLGANDKQLDFKAVYAIARAGIAHAEIGDGSKDLSPLLDLVLAEVPIASGQELVEKPLQAQVFNLAYDNFLGRLGICRIYTGTLNVGESLTVKNPTDKSYTGKIGKLYTFEGLERKEVNSASAGDIVMIAGIPDIFIGETLVSDANTNAMPAIAIDEPTISLNMFVNDSPFAGRVGKLLTSRQIRDRLEKELEVNVGLKIDFSDNARFKIFGRGELHLAVLIENMRREGFELAVSQPEVIFKDINGTKHEPYEEVTIVVPAEFSGVVIEKMGKRRGIMNFMETKGSTTKIIFSIPTRGLLGYRSEFTIDTRGEGILTTIFDGFKPYAGEVIKTEFGSMISMASGKALGFSLANLQTRGTLYIDPNVEVYEGMVVGNTAKGEDMMVNPTKGKQLTNMRASGSDENIKITPPLDLTLERALELMRADEYLEVTPTDIRLRKKYLKEHERKRAK